jgi:hypothetical protein
MLSYLSLSLKALRARGRNRWRRHFPEWLQENATTVLGAAVFSAKDVAAPAHPEHEQLQAILQDPVMQSPLVIQTFIGQLAHPPTS